MIETVGLGGAENVVFQLAEELRSRGHAVHPIVPGGREGWLLERFRSIDLKWHTYDLRRPVDLTLPGRMATTLTSLGVEVVHSHEFVMSVYGAAASRHIGVPHIVTMHGNQVMTRKLRRRVALRWAFRNSAAVAAVSQDTRKHLEASLGLRPGVIQVIPNGIPLRPGKRDETRRALGVDPSELLLLTVGSLIPRKGHAVLFEALNRLREDGVQRPWKLAIAGKGAEREKLECIVNETGLAERVQFLGPRDDVPDLQAAADVFVMPSLWEGLPLAILEAMFAGSAIVASRTSGIPEAIDEGEQGLLPPPGDVAALAAALKRVMDDPQCRADLGRKALERAQARFTIRTMADNYEQLYSAHLPVRR